MRHYLESFVVMGLVLAGLGGITYHMFRDGGWLEHSLGRLFVYAMESPLLLATMILAGIGVALWWRHDRVTRGHGRRAPTLLLYAVMAAGAYFLGKLALLHTL